MGPVWTGIFTVDTRFEAGLEAVRSSGIFIVMWSTEVLPCVVFAVAAVDAAVVEFSVDAP